MPPTVVESEDLKKHFVVDRPLYERFFAPFAAKKMICALKGVSFSIKSGEILGVIGSNGAGKTTLLRILANLLEADSGSIDSDDDTLSVVNYAIDILNTAEVR